MLEQRGVGAVGAVACEEGRNRKGHKYPKMG